MQIQLVCVGRARAVFREPIGEYERRVARYFPFRVETVKEEPHRGRGDEERVRVQEGARLLARVAEGSRVIALHRGGERMTSEALARYLGELPHHGAAALALLIGGAYGLSGECLRRADRRLSISDFTLPHEMARLVISEQLYRAGTLVRGEPYHKAQRG